MKDALKNDLLIRIRNGITLYILIISLLLGPQAISAQYSSAAKNPKIEFLQPTGLEIEGLPEMEILPDSLELYKKLTNDVQHSFIKDMLDLGISENDVRMMVSTNPAKLLGI